MTKIGDKERQRRALREQGLMHEMRQTVVHTDVYLTDDPPLPISHAELFVPMPSDPEPERHQFRPTEPAAPSKRDRTTYQRELMRRRRAIKRMDDAYEG